MSRRQWIELQFGHGGDAVGDFRTISRAAGADMLQFGHGGDAVGDIFPAGNHTCFVRASIRPRR